MHTEVSVASCRFRLGPSMVALSRTARPPGGARGSSAGAPNGRAGAPLGGQQVREWRAAAALVAVCVGVPAAIAAASGSFGLPSMDDWAYRRVAASFAATGHLQYFGWVSMSLVGQVLWAWPWLKVFGDHGWVLSVATIPLAVAAVVSAWWLARRLLPAAAAVGAVLLLLAAPGMALNT